MAFLSTMETSPVLLVLVGIHGVVLIETTPTFVHFQMPIGLTRTPTMNMLTLTLESILVPSLT